MNGRHHKDSCTNVCVCERERDREREREMVYYAKGRWVRECDAFFELIE